MTQTGRILISGAGIAGLTLAVLLKEQGHDPLVVECDDALPTEGYMMDFFGTGWDVAERMGLTDALRALRYPIDALQFVDARGDAYASVPISRVSVRSAANMSICAGRTSCAFSTNALRAWVWRSNSVRRLPRSKR